MLSECLLDSIQFSAILCQREHKTLMFNLFRTSPMLALHRDNLGTRLRMDAPPHTPMTPSLAGYQLLYILSRIISRRTQI